MAITRLVLDSSASGSLGRSLGSVQAGPTVLCVWDYVRMKHVPYQNSALFFQKQQIQTCPHLRLLLTSHPLSNSCFCHPTRQNITSSQLHLAPLAPGIPPFYPVMKVSGAGEGLEQLSGSEDPCQCKPLQLCILTPHDAVTMLSLSFLTPTLRLYLLSARAFQLLSCQKKEPSAQLYTPSHRHLAVPHSCWTYSPKTTILLWHQPTSDCSQAPQTFLLSHPRPIISSCHCLYHTGTCCLPQLQTALQSAKARSSAKGNEKDNYTYMNVHKKQCTMTFQVTSRQLGIQLPISEQEGNHQPTWLVVIIDFDGGRFQVFHLKYLFQLQTESLRFIIELMEIERNQQGREKRRHFSFVFSSLNAFL